MKKINSRKAGTTTLFLAIILSALIFVESTYVFAAIQLDRQVLINRALKNELSCILADYDRQLFNVYGIYAYELDSCDNRIFDKTIEAYGLSPEGNIEINGTDVLQVEQLRRSVSVYYAYRAGTILVSSFAQNIFNCLEELDNYGIVDGIREFMGSGAAGVVRQIEAGAAEVSEILENAEYFLGISESDSKISRFKVFFRRISNLSLDEVNPGNDFDPDDYSAGINLINGLYDFTSAEADIASVIAFHPCAVNFAAYNFDSLLEDDTTLNGTSFEDIHSGNEYDSEYILTGIEGDGGKYLTSSLIFAAVFAVTVIQTITDSEKMEYISGIAEILEAVVAALTLGAVDIPYQVFEYIIVYYYSLCESVSNTLDVLDGEKISVIEIGDLPDSFDGVFEMGYRDFVSCFMFFIPDEYLLSRMLDVLRRDYGDMYISAEVSFTSDNFCSELRDSYVLYEEV